MAGFYGSPHTAPMRSDAGPSNGPWLARPSPGFLYNQPFPSALPQFHAHPMPRQGLVYGMQPQPPLAMIPNLSGIGALAAHAATLSFGAAPIPFQPPHIWPPRQTNGNLFPSRGRGQGHYRGSSRSAPSFRHAPYDVPSNSPAPPIRRVTADGYGISDTAPDPAPRRPHATYVHGITSHFLIGLV